MKINLKMKCIQFLSIILTALLTACTSPKSPSLEITKTIKEDIKNTEQKVAKIEKDYKKLIQEQPNCEVLTIIDNVEYVKTELSTLRGKIEATEVIINAEVKSYRNEIKHLKLTNIVIISIGIIILLFLIKNKLLSCLNFLRKVFKF